MAIIKQQIDITAAELRQQYARTGLESRGIPFERGIQSDAIRITLIGGIQARRRIEARRAQAAALPYQTQEAA